jgi:hypothetical protein
MLEPRVSRISGPNAFLTLTLRALSILSFAVLASGLGLACSASADAAADAKASAPARIYFTHGESSAGVPNADAEESFDCSQKIYAVVEAKGLQKGKRRIQVLWYNPRGRKQEHTDFEAYATGNQDRFWAWLVLHRPDSGIVDRVLLQDRTSGMEDFLGTWTVKAYVDGLLVGKGSFKVFC